MITIVVIPTAHFSWTDTNFLNSVDYRLTSQPKIRDRFAVYAPGWLRRQLDEFSASLTASELLQALQTIPIPVKARCLLLPKPKRFAQWLLDVPSANIWHIPVTTLRATVASKHPSSDVYNYMPDHVPPNAEFDTVTRRVAAGRDIYVRSTKVIGAPLCLAAPAKYYAGYLSTHQLDGIYPDNWAPDNFHKREFCLTILPSLLGPRTFLLDVDADRDASYPLSVLWPQLRALALKSRLLLPPVALLRRVVDPGLKPTWSADSDAAFRALRLSRPSSASQPVGFDFSALPVVDLICLFESEPDDHGRIAPGTRLTIHSVPTDLLTSLSIQEAVRYPLRHESGMFVHWVLLALLMSDDVTISGTRRSVKLETAHASARPFVHITVERCASARVIDVRGSPAMYANAVCLTLPKGSYKSTIIDTLPAMFSDLPILEQAAVIDSDALGDSLRPSFETQFLERLENLDPNLLDRAVASILNPTSDTSDDAVTTVLDAFNALYREIMTPAQRSRLPLLTQQGRVLAFAHSDYELLSANIPIQVVRGSIPIDHVVNLLARRNRVGGTALQVLLDYCYRTQASPLAPTPAGRLYKQLFGPWLMVPRLSEPLIKLRLVASAPAKVLRAAGWTIDGDPPLEVSCLCAYVTDRAAATALIERRLDSRALVTVGGDQLMFVEYAPPLPLVSIPRTFLLPVTYVVHWVSPQRVLLNGGNVSFTSGLEWTFDDDPQVVTSTGV
nr:putative core protein NTPase/VP5 [Grass carp reovirus]